MKRSILLMICMLFSLNLNAADSFTIEVLQVSDIAAFDRTYNSLLAGLAERGLVEGQNLTVRRNVLDAEADANLFEKVGILMKIKKTAAEIINRKPDMVVTITTPAAKYSRDKFVAAGIPLIFSVVAIPEEIGCASKTVAGPGFSGVTIYQDPQDVIKVGQLALPNMKVLGIVHSDDDNAVAYTEETKLKAAAMGLKVISKQVKKSDRIGPHVEELIAQGVDTFFIPIDTYYGLRDYEVAIEMRDLSWKHKIPVISAVKGETSGPIMYMAPNFSNIGRLTSQQVAAVLLEGKDPASLPILKQAELDIIVHPDSAAKVGIELPLEILQVATILKKID